MALDISDAFITQFESEVHVAYQRMGSKLRPLGRNITGVTGSTARFQKVGTGTAVTKARNADVAAMNLTHSSVDVTLSDYYAADYIDRLDELKTNIDERQVVALNAAAALGRKTDELITTALDGTSNTTAHGSAGINTTKIFGVFESMGENDVPDDGQRYWVVAPDQWTELLAITAFADADFIGSDDLPYKGGMTAKRWLGYVWMVHSGLPDDGSSNRKTFCWHKSGIGVATGADIATEVNYVPEKVSNLVTSMLSQGAVLIDDNAVFEVQCSE